MVVSRRRALIRGPDLPESTTRRVIAENSEVAELSSTRSVPWQWGSVPQFSSDRSPRTASSSWSGPSQGAMSPGISPGNGLPAPGQPASPPTSRMGARLRGHQRPQPRQEGVAGAPRLVRQRIPGPSRRAGEGGLPAGDGHPLPRTGLSATPASGSRSGRGSPPGRRVGEGSLPLLSAFSREPPPSFPCRVEEADCLSSRLGEKSCHRTRTPEYVSVKGESPRGSHQP